MGMLLRTLMVSSLAVWGVAPAAAAERHVPPVPSLLAKAPGLAKRVRLPLHAEDFDVVRQRAADRVTLRWPATRYELRDGRRVRVRVPCATTTISLSIAAGQTDAVARARTLLPGAT